MATPHASSFIAEMFYIKSYTYKIVYTTVGPSAYTPKG